MIDTKIHITLKESRAIITDAGFPPDDLGSCPKTQFIIIYLLALLSNWSKSFLRDIYIPRVGVAMMICQIMR